MLCAIARLPEEARIRLRAVQAAAGRLGYAPPPLYGHITLAVCDRGDEAAFAKGCRELLTGFGVIDVEYEKVEILTQTAIIVATPSKSGGLLSAHDVLAERFGDSLDAWTRDALWRPHTTLFHHPTAPLESVCRAMAARYRSATGSQ